jgi:hypothetical protein
LSFRSLISALLPTSHIEDPGVLGNGKRKTFISLAACMGWEIALRILSPYTTGSTWQSMNHHIKPLPCIGRQVISPNLSISQANCRYRSAEGRLPQNSVLGRRFRPKTQSSKIYNPVFCIKYIKSAKTFLFRIVYTHLCIKLGRNWVTGFLAMPRLGPKLGSAEV